MCMTQFSLHTLIQKTHQLGLMLGLKPAQVYYCKSLHDAIERDENVELLLNLHV